MKNNKKFIAAAIVGAALFFSGKHVLGKGVPKNLTLAKVYLTRAAENGETQAYQLLSGIDEQI